MRPAPFGCHFSADPSAVVGMWAPDFVAATACRSLTYAISGTSAFERLVSEMRFILAMTPLAEPEQSLYRVFEEHSAELYWLAFLLTGDREQGVAAFTRAVDFEEGANPVFREFMISWARKLIIAQALAGIRPQLRDSLRKLQTENWSHGPLPSDSRAGRLSVSRPEFESAVLALDAFQRCAVLLTVFERLSVAETALLLDADVELVKKAQVRGLVELTRNIALGRGWDHSSALDGISVTSLRAALGPVGWPTCVT
jgi:DNA-directed RNA polymerase specialized sigma24 family protein